MKPSNWENKSHSVARWMAKLTEEVGEVGKEIAEHPKLLEHPKTVQRAMTELEHVELIARNFRLDLERKLSA